VGSDYLRRAGLVYERNALSERQQFEKVNNSAGENRRATAARSGFGWPKKKRKEKERRKIERSRRG